MHPILFEIPTPWGPLPIYSYGVMLGISMILGWNFVMYFGRKERYFPQDPKRNEEFLANAFMVCVVAALAGARILYMITNPEEFDSLAQIFALRRGGLVAYGGFLGGFFAAVYWVRVRQGIGLLRFSDGAAPALALGLGLTRIGCYAYGCDFGARLSENAPAWLRALGTFPHWEDGTGAPAWVYHVQEHGLPRSAEHSYPVHPTQLYESSIGLLLFALCLFVWARRKFHGQVILTLAMAYGVWRFFIEYVRDDPGRGELFGFSTSQLISLSIVPLAAFAYARELGRWKHRPYPVVRLFETEALATTAGAGKEGGTERPVSLDPPDDAARDAASSDASADSRHDERARASGLRGASKKKKTRSS